MPLLLTPAFAAASTPPARLCPLACSSLLTQEGICLTLNPEFHFLEVAYPYVARRLLTDEDPALRSRLVQVGTGRCCASL
jgi:predicted unusual protein kinase regulating ubiquinone biosynthesis (AarF/ABC1/UbiB family)